MVNHSRLVRKKQHNFLLKLLDLNIATALCSSQLIAFYITAIAISLTFLPPLSHVSSLSVRPPSSPSLVYLQPNIIIPFRVQVEFYVNENTFKERLKLFFIKNQRSSEFLPRPRGGSNCVFSCPVRWWFVFAFTWSAVDPCEWLCEAGAG